MGGRAPFPPLACPPLLACLPAGHTCSRSPELTPHRARPPLWLRAEAHPGQAWTEPLGAGRLRLSPLLSCLGLSQDFPIFRARLRRPGGWHPVGEEGEGCRGSRRACSGLGRSGSEPPICVCPLLLGGGWALLTPTPWDSHPLPPNPFGSCPGTGRWWTPQNQGGQNGVPDGTRSAQTCHCAMGDCGRPPGSSRQNSGGRFRLPWREHPRLASEPLHRCEG